MSNLLYHIAYINKRLFVAECCFICSTNLSFHHSMQGVCWSGISGGSATIPGSIFLSLSGWREGAGETWLNRIQNLIQYLQMFCMNLQGPNAICLYYTYETEFRSLLRLKKGLHAAQNICTILWFSTAEIIVRARVVEHA